MTLTQSAAWPRYYPAGLAVWLVGFPVVAILMQVGSGFALVSEQGPMFRLGCGLLALLGSACFVTGFAHAGSTGSRATWCLAGVIAFSMIAIEHDDALQRIDSRHDDYIDGLALLLTATVLALMTRLEHPPASVTRLLVLGFALQSTGLFVDLGDGGIFDVPQTQALVMGTLDEILDLVLVVVYCASFLAMAVHVRVAAIADDTPAATIHRRARTARWKEASLRSAADNVLWVLLVPVTAALVTWRNGRVVARRHGRSVVRQLGDQLRLAFLLGAPPSHYYVFELFDDDARAHARDYLFRYETKGFAYAVLRGRPITPLTNKLAFFRRCEAHRLSVVPVVLALDHKGQVLAPAFGPAELPPVDLFLKPNPGKGGRGAERWDYVGDGRYRRFGGETLSAAGVLARLEQRPFASGCIVQPRVSPHADLAVVGQGALPTVRVVTCRHRDGRVVVTNAVFRMARGRDTVVDNFHAGGIAAAVDVASGRLGRATDLGRDTRFGWVDVHPDTGAAITGRRLPRWDETLELATRAHREAFADRVVIGWDIAILDDGPALVEGNSSPDLDIVQRTHRQPVGGQRLGVLLAAALAQAEADAPR